MLGTVSCLFAGDTNSYISTVRSLLLFLVVVYAVTISQDKSSKFARLFVIMERIIGKSLCMMYKMEIGIMRVGWFLL